MAFRSHFRIRQEKFHHIESEGGARMRFFSGLFLITLAVLLGFLAYQNNIVTTLNAWNWQADVPLPVLIIAVYLLGMLSGWWLFGLVKRSWQARDGTRSRISVVFVWNNS